MSKTVNLELPNSLTIERKLHIGEPNRQGMARTYRNHYPSRIDRKIRSLEADVIYSSVKPTTAFALAFTLTQTSATP